MSHAGLAVIFQLVLGIVFGRWVLAAVATVTFFIGREVTQAEYRWIEEFGEGRRASMPWWGGVDPAVWNAKSLMDIAYPALATMIVLLVMRLYQRR